MTTREAEQNCSRFMVDSAALRSVLARSHATSGPRPRRSRRRVHAAVLLIGLALVGYSLNRYNLIDLDKWIGKKGAGSGGSGEVVDATKPLVLPVSSSESDAEVRVRVNIWVGCAGGLVANGGRIGYVASAAVYHLHDETWGQVGRRFEREAIALQHIMPEVELARRDVVRYFFSAVLLDMGEAEALSSALCFR